MTPEDITLCRALVANQRLSIEERAALAALLATFERLAKLPSLWGVEDATSPTGNGLHRRHFTGRMDALDITKGREKYPVVPLTLAAMLEDAT